MRPTPASIDQSQKSRQRDPFVAGSARGRCAAIHVLCCAAGVDAIVRSHARRVKRRPARAKLLNLVGPATVLHRHGSLPGRAPLVPPVPSPRPHGAHDRPQVRRALPPWGKRGKSDPVDAAAICEAVQQPNMRFVTVKSLELQGWLCLHRVRQGFIEQRTACINRIRGLLSEFGIVLALKAAIVRREALQHLENLPGCAGRCCIATKALRCPREHGTPPSISNTGSELRLISCAAWRLAVMERGWTCTGCACLTQGGGLRLPGLTNEAPRASFIRVRSKRPARTTVCSFASPHLVLLPSPQPPSCVHLICLAVHDHSLRESSWDGFA
jgi:hypothetical protein